MRADAICIAKNRSIKARRNMLRYWWRWFYLRYVKVIISAIITAILDIIGELYIEKKRG